MVLLFLLTYCKKKKIELHKNSDVLKVTFFFFLHQNEITCCNRLLQCFVLMFTAVEKMC